MHFSGELYTGQTGRSFETRFKEHFFSFKNNNCNSKFTHVLEKNNYLGKMEDMKAVYYDHKGRYLDTVKEFFIYKEPIKGIQLNHKILLCIIKLKR